MAAQLEVGLELFGESRGFLHEPGDFTVGESRREFVGLGGIEPTWYDHTAAFGEAFEGTDFDGSAHVESKVGGFLAAAGGKHGLAWVKTKNAEVAAFSLSGAPVSC